MFLTSNAALYGKGVFTTVAFRDAEPCLWEKHWRRLTLHARKLGIDISDFDEVSTRESVLVAIREFGSSAGRVRVSFLDNSTSERWGSKAAGDTTLSVIAGPLREVQVELRLTVSPFLVNSTSPLSGIKSCNYLEHLIAFEEATSRGFDEAIRLNERGEVASACMANVFWSTGGKLYTPSLKTGCLPGTTREYILENIECEEVEAGIDAIREGDEIFLTSAGIGVVPVAVFEARELKNTGHPITRVLPF